jgi:hypothetical protein
MQAKAQPDWFEVIHLYGTKGGWDAKASFKAVYLGWKNLDPANSMARRRGRGGAAPAMRLNFLRRR